MQGRHHPGTNVFASCLADQLGHCLPCSTAERTEQLTAMQEERTEQLGNREGPHAVPDLFEDLLLQEGPEDGAPLGGTGGAEPSSRT
jgi:hypothetical protein